MGGNAARAKRRRVAGSAKQRIQKKKIQRILRNAKTSGWGFKILRCTASDEEKSRSVIIQSQQWLSAWSDLCICLGRWSVTSSTRKSRTELEGASPVQWRAAAGERWFAGCTPAVCGGAFVLHKAPCPVPRGLHVGRLIPGKFFVILRSRIDRFHESFHHGSNDVRSNLREASGGCQCGLQGLVKDGINLEVCRVTGTGEDRQYATQSFKVSYGWIMRRSGVRMLSSRSMGHPVGC